MCDVKVRITRATCVSEVEAIICLRSTAMPNNDSDLDDFKPPMKRPKLTKRMKVFPDQHFLALKSDEVMKRMVHGYIPPNTAMVSWLICLIDW